MGTSPAGTSAGAGSLSGAPLTLETWNDPVSNDPVQVLFTQSIGATDALRTGSVQQDADVHALDDDSVSEFAPARASVTRLGSPV